MFEEMNVKMVEDHIGENWTGIAARAVPVSLDVREELGGTGSIRVAINVANTIVANVQKDGSLSGTAIEVAREIGECVGLSIEFKLYDDVSAILADVDRGEWDIAFIARDPSREALLHFTPAYMEIAATFAVRRNSGFARSQELDRSDVVIASASGAAYDLCLRRVIAHAMLSACDSHQSALDRFSAGEVDAVAGIRQQLARFAASNIYATVVQDNFATLGQPIAVRCDRPAAGRWLDDWIARKTRNR